MKHKRMNQSVPRNVTHTMDGILDGAQWIWGGDNPRPLNEFRMFRREFDLKDIPSKVELFAFAEFRYKLFINGQFVQAGPTCCQPNHRLVDRHDVTRFLKRGGNCVGFIVHCPGIMTGQWTLCNPALLCCVRSTEGCVIAASDSSWRTVHGDAWRSPTELCGYGKGWQEWHVMERMPSGWNEAGFKDGSWEEARERPFMQGGRADQLMENYIGYPTLKEHIAGRVARLGVADGVLTEEMRKEASYIYMLVRNRFQRMFGHWPLNTNTPLPPGTEFPEPIAMRAEKEKYSAAPNGVFVTQPEPSLPINIIARDGVGHPYALLDLGIVRSGFITLEMESESGGVIDIAYDDRLGDDGRLHPHRATPNCERVEVPKGRVRWEGFFERGLRYAQVIFRSFNGNITLRSVGVRETLSVAADAPHAEFHCDDKLLNRIWQAAVETTRLYMTGGCASGDPVRERAHWFNDDTQAARMAFYCFSEWRVWRRALELTAQSQNTDGSFHVISPGHFEDFNLVVSSCNWVAQVAEYVREVGDLEFGRRMLAHISRHIDYELRFSDGNGLLYETPGRRFLSWADGEPRTPYKTGETWAKKSRKSWGDFFDPPTRGFNAIINTSWLWCLREAATLAGQLGETENGKNWREMFETARKAFDSKFWDKTTGLYRDNVAFDAQGHLNPPAFCESTLFFLLRAGLLDHKRALGCVDRIFQPDFVCCRSSGGFELGALPPFLIATGRTLQALEIYRDRWGQPLLAGATTCGEEFFRFGGNSDCHIHGATPARDFIEFIAGIRLAGPFFEKVIFAPAREAPELQCKIPIPQGWIMVRIEKVSGAKRRFFYEVPAECKAFRQAGSKTIALKKQSGVIDYE